MAKRATSNGTTAPAPTPAETSAGADTAKDSAQGMTDSDLLRLCELPGDAPAEVVDMVKLAAVLVERSGDGPAGAAVALASAMGRAGGWSVESLPFGYEGPRVEHKGWIKRDDLAVKLAQLGGLIVGGRFNADCANVAVAEALRNYWLREQRFDTWRPGMESGSGWTTVVQAQPAGIARARELAAAPAEVPRPWQATPAPPVHNADFTMVNWYGTEYHFALGVQSSAVAALWAEWEKTGLGLHQDTIRNAVDAERDSFRMDTAFRNHPAFGTMIQRCGDGRYKLAPPTVTPAPEKKKNAGITAKSRRKHA